MAELPADVGTGIIRVQVQGMEMVGGGVIGNYIPGKVTFTPRPTHLTHVGSGTIYPTFPISVYLKKNTVVHATLVATDDPQITPINWTYQVTFDMESGTQIASFDITVPEGSDRELSDITPVQDNTGVFYIQQGPAGPQGPPGPPGADGADGEVTDHGALTGLLDDDHTQYHNDTRGDVRYYTKSAVDTALSGKASTYHGHVIADTTGLQAALDGKQAAGSYATSAQGTKADTAVQPAALTAYATDAELTAGLGGKVDKGETVTPDDFTGTDRARLQAAVNYCTANGYPTIILDRMLDLTGQPAVSIDKAVWSIRDVVTFEGSGGGIVKHDAGTVFTTGTANTGDIAIRGVKFESTSGAGTILWDGDNLIRISSSECEYRDWDLIFSQTTVGRYAQSVRFHKEHIVGGTGPAFKFRESYDVTIDDCLIEDRTAGVWNSDGTMTTLANRQLRITNNAMENMSGIPIKLAMCWGAVIDTNYFEANGAATDPQIDLYTLAVSASQRAVVLRANQVQQTAAQKAAHVGAILIGNGVPAAPLVTAANINDGGILFQFGSPANPVTLVGSGDYSESGGLVVYPGQEDHYLSTIGKSGTTEARPKSPVIGRGVYFDTTLGKPVWPKTAGTKAQVSLQYTSGASTTGTITLTILGTPFTVPVVAGDTAAQVRTKTLADASTFFPTWKPSAYLTDAVIFTAIQRGLVSGALSFAAGGTGVTVANYGLDNAGTDPVWVDATGTSV